MSLMGLWSIREMAGGGGCFFWTDQRLGEAEHYLIEDYTIDAEFESGLEYATLIHRQSIRWLAEVDIDGDEFYIPYPQEEIRQYGVWLGDNHQLEARLEAVDGKTKLVYKFPSEATQREKGSCERIRISYTVPTLREGLRSEGYFERRLLFHIWVVNEGATRALTFRFKAPDGGTIDRTHPPYARTENPHVIVEAPPNRRPKETTHVLAEVLEAKPTRQLWVPLVLAAGTFVGASLFTLIIQVSWPGALAFLLIVLFAILGAPWLVVRLLAQERRTTR